MATKKNDDNLVKYRCLNSRGLRLSIPGDAKKGIQPRHIVFQGGVYFSGDEEIIKFLDNHPGNLRNREESGQKPSFARAEDVESATAAEHKAVKKELEQTKDELKKLQEKEEDRLKQIRALQAQLRRTDKKSGKKDTDNDEDDL